MGTWDEPAREIEPYRESQVITGEIDDGPPPPELIDAAPVEYKRRVALPIILFLLTCLSTLYAGGSDGVRSLPATADFEEAVHVFFRDGLLFSIPVMLILLAHEFGHFLQTVRYKTPASFPFFIPFPLSPIGTMGAVIVMRGQMGNRKSLFDNAVSGPLAGLVPTVICLIVGLQLSTVEPFVLKTDQIYVGSPYLFSWLADWFAPPRGPNTSLHIHPVAFAGWVGTFLTAVNLFPIGQLDGGHILYALLRRQAHAVAVFVLYAAVVGMVITGYWGWSLMLGLLALAGPRHPPTGDDNVPLGAFRIVLGWLTLAFVIIGFTPMPFMIF